MTLKWLTNFFQKNAQQQKLDDQKREQQEWNKLFADIKANMTKGPEDPEVQKLVERYEQMMKKYTPKAQNTPVNIHNNLVPEGIREYAIEFADPSAFIQKAIAFKYNKSK